MDNNWTSSTNWMDSVAPVAGDDLVFPAGPTRRQPNNDFPAGTSFNTLILSGPSFGQPYVLSGNSIRLNAGVIATNGAGGRINPALVLNSNQSFIIQVGANSFFLPGAIDTNGKDLTFDVALPSMAQVQATISGAGGLIKTGLGSLFIYSTNTFAGTVDVRQGHLSVYSGGALGSANGGTSVSAEASLALLNEIVVLEPFTFAGAVVLAGAGAKTLNGPIELIGSNCVLDVSLGTPTTVNGLVSGVGGFTKAGSGVLALNANNTYVGSSTVNAGTLRVNGVQPQSHVTLNFGGLDGTGTVGTVAVGGVFATFVAPGSNGPGSLTCSNLTLGALTSFLVELNGTSAGTGYDQLNVRGTVTLNNALLSVSSTLSFSGGESFVIINNDGTDAVAGSFAGLAEGATVDAGTNQFQISYVGGDGNDVELRPVTTPAPAPRLTIELLPANAVRLLWPTNPAGFHLQASPGLLPTDWAAATPPPAVVATNHVLTNSAGEAQRFYRLFKP